MEHRIKTPAELEALYGEPNPNSLAKETSRLTEEYRRLLDAAPFVAVATMGEGGLDCSPRGDPAPVVHVLDDRTLVLPDRRGNNRLDTLRNIVADPRIAILFVIPGCSETLRVNGRAHITTDPGLLAKFSMQGREPVTAIVVEIETVYFQCARALVRSGLWEPETWPDRSGLPTAGKMVKAALPGFDAETYDREAPEKQAKTLY